MKNQYLDLWRMTKKNNHSLINFSLPKKIGEVIIDVEINKIEVKSILKEFKVNG